MHQSEAIIFVDEKVFDLEDLFTVFEHMNDDGRIWWIRPLVEGKKFNAVIATTENSSGIPEGWSTQTNLDRDEWKEAYNQWRAAWTR